MRYYITALLLFLSFGAFLCASHQEEYQVVVKRYTFTSAAEKNVIEYINNQKYTLSHVRSTNCEKTLGDGLADTNLVEQKLNEQDYVGVLLSIWSEQDFNRRKQWLETRANEGHPLLMIEYGKVLAQQGSIEEGLKWFYLGLFRAQQDAYCCECAPFDMTDQLLEREAYPKQWFDIMDDLLKRKTMYPLSQKKMKQAALAVLKAWKSFPSPQWMAHCVPEAKRGEPVGLKPQEDWPKMRQLVIQEQEQKIKNLVRQEQAQKLIHEEQQELNNKQIFGFRTRLRPLHMLIGLGVCGISLYLLKKCFAKTA